MLQILQAVFQVGAPDLFEFRKLVAATSATIHHRNGNTSRYQSLNAVRNPDLYCVRNLN